eukprot:g16433.t1
MQLIDQLWASFGRNLTEHNSSHLRDLSESLMRVRGMAARQAGQRRHTLTSLTRSNLNAGSMTLWSLAAPASVVASWNRDKLAKMASKCRTRPKVIVASTPEEIHQMAEEATVVKACVEKGTHYVDITGEYHQQAKEKSLQLVQFAGAMCVPDDMGAYLLARKLGPLKQLRVYTWGYSFRGGGSFQTGLTVVERMLPDSMAHRLSWGARIFSCVFGSTSKASEEIDVDIVVGPNPSQAVRHIMTQQFQKLVEGCDHEGLRRRAMQGPISTRKKVALSDCQILSRMSSDRQPRSFGTTLHLGVNCTILCQVCSFSGTLRACKKSWLCDFCHALSPQCRNRRKGSGAWQVSQLSQERILELYEALQNTVERGHEDAQVNLPPHPRTIPDPQTRRVWRSEARGAAPHVASRANTWGGEGTDNYDQRHRPQRSQNRQYSYSSWHSEGPQTFAPSLMSRNVQDVSLLEQFSAQ